MSTLPIGRLVRQIQPLGDSCRPTDPPVRKGFDLADRSRPTSSSRPTPIRGTAKQLKKG